MSVVNSWTKLSLVRPLSTAIDLNTRFTTCFSNTFFPYFPRAGATAASADSFVVCSPAVLFGRTSLMKTSKIQTTMLAFHAPRHFSSLVTSSTSSPIPQHILMSWPSPCETRKRESGAVSEKSCMDTSESPSVTMASTFSFSLLRTTETAVRRTSIPLSMREKSTSLRNFPTNSNPPKCSKSSGFAPPSGQLESMDRMHCRAYSTAMLLCSFWSWKRRRVRDSWSRQSKPLALSGFGFWISVPSSMSICSCVDFRIRYVCWPDCFFSAVNRSLICWARRCSSASWRFCSAVLRCCLSVSSS
mmetsp:Transcript_16884/g.27874  ORF Transcript_16884/g.27874 Transcript_16884/m.27874 type:complete len:301 (-) Transcript_16884:1605-2507(-)